MVWFTASAPCDQAVIALLPPARSVPDDFQELAEKELPNG
jgi:hypothetical protein